MNHSETDLRKQVLEHMGFLGHWSIIESHATSTGVPDLAYCVDGVDGWLELKHTRNKKMPRIRPAQRKWISAHWRARGRPLILFEIRGKFGLIEGRYINHLFADAKNETTWWKYAHKRWEDHPNWVELTGELTARREDDE